MRRIVQLSGLVLAALTATACVAGPGAGTTQSVGAPTPTTGPTETPGTPTIDHPTGRDALILRITIDGGFVPVEIALTTLPVISIYGDGRVIVQGPQIEIYPGPALPNLQVRTITEAGLQKVLAAAVRAGLLGADRHYDDGGNVADAPTTTFTLTAGGGTHTISAYALLEEAVPGANLSKEDAEARKRLREFLAAVTDLETLAGASELTAEKAYAPHALRLFLTERPAGSEQVDPQLPQEEVAWPLATPIDEFGAPLGFGGDLEMRCGVAEGSDLDTLLPLIEKANVLTPWTSAGTTWSMAVRPLLPDESGCGQG